MYTDNPPVSKCTQLVQMIINPELEQKKNFITDCPKMIENSNGNLKSYFRLNVNTFMVGLH